MFFTYGVFTYKVIMFFTYGVFTYKVRIGHI